VSFVPTVMQPISAEEQLKIASFYRSFGTSLYTANTAACLYTIVNLKPNTNKNFQHESSAPMNRASIAFSNGNTSKISNKMVNMDIDHDILRDFMNNKYQSHVSVYHRGIPLWLFNSGSNPRRPHRQLKFTLAEKGTGFILWQVMYLGFYVFFSLFNIDLNYLKDRIDSCSEFKIYGLCKNDLKIINFTTYLEKRDYALNELNYETVNEMFASMIITFKASDRKTTVFVKFDLNNETALFYDYFIHVNRIRINEFKERTKSLPGKLNKYFIFYRMGANRILEKISVVSLSIFK